MKIASFFNVKGGVGKTTLTILTSMTLSQEGKKILIIDADTQANLTQFLYKVNHNDKTIFSALTENISADKLIIKSPNKTYPNVDLIPADLSLFVLNEYLALQTGREKTVYRWFKDNYSILKDYDYIFVDLSPSYDLTARNFMLLSDSVITPIKYQDIASIRGCQLFYLKLNQDLKTLEIDPEFKRVVVINSYTSRKLSSGNDFMEKLHEYKDIEKDLLNTKLSESTTVIKSISEKLSVEDYCKVTKKKHKIVDEFKSFIQELKEREVL